MHIVLVSDLRKLNHSILSRAIIFSASLELDNISVDGEYNRAYYRLEETGASERDQLLIQREVLWECNPHETTPHYGNTRYQADLVNSMLPTIWSVYVVKCMRGEWSMLCNTPNLQLHQSLPNFVFFLI